MRTTLFLLAIGLGLSCGGPLEGPSIAATPIDDAEIAPVDQLRYSTWPDAVDLGVVVSSEIDPAAALPPPPDARVDFE